MSKLIINGQEVAPGTKKKLSELGKRMNEVIRQAKEEAGKKEK